MSLISALANVHHQGQFGDFEDKKGDDLLKIYEKKNLLIVQIVQFKNSNIPIESIDIDGLKFKDSPLKNKVIPVEIVSSHYVDPKGERVRS